MKRSGRSVQRQHKLDGLAPAVVLSACFVGAGLAGCLTAAAAGADGTASLAEFLSSYLSLLAEDGAETPSLWAAAWELCRWPLLTLLLGFTALGAAAIPAVFCVRGFLLAYSIASFVRVFGAPGLLAAFAVFGVTALMSVPALFGVGAAAFPSALRLAMGVLGERPTGPPARETLASLAPCGALLAPAVFLQWAVMPQVLYAVSGLLPVS